MDILGIINLPGYVIYSLVVFLLLFIHTRIKYGYWRKQGVPALMPLPIIGTHWTGFSNTPTYETEMKQYKKHKRFGLYEFGTNVLVTGEPEDLKKVLVKDFDVFTNRRQFNTGKDSILDLSLFNLEDDEWSHTRNVVTPLFTGSKLRKMNERVAECGRVLQKCLEKIAATEKEFDAQRLFGSFALDVIASVAFKTNINSMENPDTLFLQHAKRVFEFSFMAKIALFFPGLAKLLGISVVDPVHVNFFKSMVQKISKLRESEKTASTDFISLLKEQIKDTKDNEYALTEDKMLAQCVTFFTAGYDTTASVVTMAAYNLVMHPECQKRLQKEIDEAIEKHGELTYDAISDMSYLNAVVKETLRMYSPAARGERVVGKDYQLGDIFLKKGSIVAFPIYAIHHDPDLWPDPFAFKPERFLGDQKEIGTFSFLPFGSGRRNCIAMRLAMVEVKMAISSCLQKHTLLKTNTFEYPPKTRTTIGMFPKAMTFGVERRTKD